MGTRERRQREVAERDSLFLDAARELICQEGLLNLQMARVAENCDYAVGTLYQHFASKEDLLVALATTNAERRVAMFERVAQWKAGTRDRMFGIAVAEVQLMRLHAEHFRLEQFAFTEVIWGAASPARREQALKAGEPIGRIVESIVSEAQRVGDLDLKGLRPFELSLAPWALSSGTHMIAHTEGVTEKYDVRDPYRLMLRHQQSLMNGLGWKPLFDPSDDKALEAKIKQLCTEVFHDLPCDK